jgi:hypothetical protein
VTTPPQAPTGTQQAELGLLLAGAVRGVVAAQDVLDTSARERAEGYLAAPAGTLALPPLWFAFDAVSLEIEVSSEVTRTAAGQTRLLCRTVNPVTVGLYGYTASTGTRVRVSLVPQRFTPSEVTPSPT